MNTSLSRRDLLVGAAATAATLTLPKASALAQDDELLVYGYPRDVAVATALEFYNQPKMFETNCAYFLSSVLWAVGVPKSDEWTNDSTDDALLATWSKNPGPTVAAALAREFAAYLVSMNYATKIPLGWRDDSALEAQPGDIIAYCWGSDSEVGDGEIGTIDHVGMVSAPDPEDGFPLIVEHSPDNLTRYWSYSNARDGWIEHVYPDSQAWLLRMDFITVSDY